MRRRAAVGLVSLMSAGLVVPVLSQGAPTAPLAAAWTKLGRDENTVVPVPSIALDGAKVAAAWAVPGPSGGSIQAATINPTLSASERAPLITDVVAGWASVGSPVILAKAGGGLQVMIDASHSLTTGDPLNGLSFAPRSPDGAWGQPVSAGVSSGGSTAILASDGITPLVATTSSGVFRIYRGAVKPTEVNLSAVLGPTDEYQIPRLGRDGTGRFWLAWYGGGRAPNPAGLHLVQLDPATGNVIGVPAIAPASGGIRNATLSIALACGPVDCRLVYHETRENGTDTNRILTWAPGEAASTVALASADTGPELSAAYRAEGRLWIAWYDRAGNGSYGAKLGDARGGGGQTVRLGLPPHAQSHSSGAISAIEVAGNLAIVTNFENSGVYNAWFTVASPQTSAPSATAVDTSGIPNPQVIRRGAATFVIPTKPSLQSLRRRKCVNVRVQTAKPAVIRVAIFSGRKSIRVFGSAVVRFAGAGKRTVCVRVPLRAHSFDVRQPFRFAFAVKLGAHPGKTTPGTVTTSGFLNFG